jgi:hypothetical protein
MRTVHLAHSVFQAERLRWRLRVKRLVARLVFALIAATFLLGALTFVHVAVFLWAAPHWGGIIAALAVGGFDLVVALILLLLAMQGGTTAGEREALAIREVAWREMMRTLTLIGLLKPLAGLAFRQFRRKRG